MKLNVLLYMMYLLVIIHPSISSLKAQVFDTTKIDADSIRGMLKVSTEAFSQSTKEEEEKGVYLLELAEKLALNMDDPYLEIEINRKKIVFFLIRTIQMELKNI